MAGGAEIGALRVNIGADTAELEKGLKQSQMQMAAFAGTVAGVVTAATEKAIEALGRMKDAFFDVTDNMDKVGKASQQLGIPVEKLSALKHAAELADVPFDALVKGMGKFNQAIVNAVNKPTEEAANAFRALGITGQQLQAGLKDPAQLFVDLAGRFEKLNDGAAKSTAAMTLFGKAGKALVPLLNEGKDGITALMLEASKLGITFDTETAQKAQKFNDTLKTLSAAKAGIIVQVTTKMLPIMQVLADVFLKNATNSEKTAQKVSILTSIFEGVARTILFVADNMKIFLQLLAVFIGAQVISTIVGIASAFVGLAKSIQAVGIVMAAVEGIRKISLVGWLLLAGGIAVLTGNFDTMVKSVKDIGSAIQNALPESAGANLKNLLGALSLNFNALDADLTKLATTNTNTKKTQEDLNAAMLGGKNALQQYLDGVQKSISAKNAEISTLGLSVMEQEKAKVMTELYTQAALKKVAVDQQLIDKALKLAEAQGFQRVQMEAWQERMADLSPVEKQTEAYQKYKEQLDLGLISADEFEKKMRKVAQAVTDEWTTATAGLAGGFSQMFKEMAKQGKEFAMFSKALAIVEATINTYQAFTKALVGSTPPWNYIMAAGVLAAGMAKVMAISSQTIPTAAVGFSGIVPGGFGGGDSKLFQAMVEPGEAIDITPGTDVRSGRGGATVVDLRGLQPGRYSLDEVKQIMKGIGDAMGFGYKFETV